VPEPVLVAFSGLPGTGKTTLARALAARLGAAYLRVDSIEHALARCSLHISPAEDAGYVAAYALAADNLRNGLSVVADSVNPVAPTRTAWAEVAHSAGARLANVEVRCSDEAEHRRRVETRRTDLEGHALPTWQQVCAREYAPWDGPRLVVDTARQGVEEALEAMAASVAAARPRAG
jgi:predicted kinase